MAEVSLLTIGEITKPHGIRGEVVVRPYSGSCDGLVGADLIHVRRAGGAGPVRALRVLQARPHKGTALMLLEGTRTRNDAETLRGLEVLVDRSLLPELEEDEFYFHQLIGMTATDPDGGSLGEVVDVFENQAGGVMVVRCDGADRMVPIVAELVPELDPGSGRLVINPIPGLLDDE